MLASRATTTPPAVQPRPLMINIEISAESARTAPDEMSKLPWAKMKVMPTHKIMSGVSWLNIELILNEENILPPVAAANITMTSTSKP